MSKIIMTGCCSSFGKTVREHLESQGHTVFGVGLSGPDYGIDFTELNGQEIESEVNHIFAKAFDALDGGPDILINNAGITKIDFLEEHKLQDFEQVMKVNLTWPFMLCKGFVHNYTPRPLARIINVSSMGATMALRASPGYCASKAGIEMLTKQLAKEFAGRHKIITCCIAPGGVEDTGMVQLAVDELQRTRGMTKEQAEAYNKQSPLGRNMRHDELVQIFDFAVNSMPEYMSGTVLKCTGGMGL